MNEIIIGEDNTKFWLQDANDSNKFKELTNSIPKEQVNEESGEQPDLRNNETGEPTVNNIHQLDNFLPQEEQLDQPNEVTKLYDQFKMENDCDCKFNRIVDYRFKQGILLLKTKFFDDDDQTTTLEIPFSILKKDVPLELEKIIKHNVVKERRNGRYTWTKKTIIEHERNICWLPVIQYQYLTCLISKSAKW